MFIAKQPFELPHLPPPIDLASCPDFNEIIRLHNEAQKHVSELNGALNQIDNPHLFLSPFYLRESIKSNAVENIHTTIEAALKDETKPIREQQFENKEVIKYREALLAGQKSLKEFGLSSRTIKVIHKALDVKKGNPGEFRKVQNAIANTKQDGSSVQIYTPPIHVNIESLLGNWENYIEHNNLLLPLIKIAVCHYQFEAIHPFEDGNGRTGRILMVLQFIYEKLLDQPLLFISSSLSENETQYKELLLNISKTGDWWSYIVFMLNAFSIEALKTKIILLKLKASRKNFRETLYADTESKIKKTNIKLVVDHLFQHPCTHPKHMEKMTSIHWQTCSKYLTYLSKKNLLSKDPVGKYVFYTNHIALSALIEE